MKTPQEMAEEWANGESDLWFADISTYTDGHKSAVKQAFLAGYQAARATYKDAIETYEDVAKQMLHEAVRTMSPKEQLEPQPFHKGADVYIIDANNPLPKPPKVK